MLLATLSGMIGCDHASDLDRIQRELQGSTGIGGSAGAAGRNAFPGSADTPPGAAGSEAQAGAAAEPPAGGGAGGSAEDTATGPEAPPQAAKDALTLEPNDTFLEAAPLTLDHSYPYVSLGVDGDAVDYYRFPVEAGATYTLDILNELGCHLDFEVGLGPEGTRAALLSPRSTVVNQTGGFQENVRSHVVEELESPETGIALIRIAPSILSDGCSKYGLSVYQSTSAGLQHDPVSLEPNDSPSTAADVAYGSAQKGMSFAAYYDANDFYRFPAAVAGSSYSLILDNPRGCYLYYTLSAENGPNRQPLLGPTSTFSLSGDVQDQVIVSATPSIDGPLLLAVETALVSYSCDGYDVTLQLSP